MRSIGAGGVGCCFNCRSALKKLCAFCSDLAGISIT